MLPAGRSTVRPPPAPAFLGDGRILSSGAPRRGQAAAGLLGEVQASVRCRGLIRGYNWEVRDGSQDQGTRADARLRGGSPRRLHTSSSRGPPRSQDGRPLLRALRHPPVMPVTVRLLQAPGSQHGEQGPRSAQGGSDSSGSGLQAPHRQARLRVARQPSAGCAGLPTAPAGLEKGHLLPSRTSPRAPPSAV